MLGALARQADDVARVSARAGVRASAVDELRSLATGLADAAVPMHRPFDLWKSRLAAPNLMPLGAGDAARAVDDLRSLVRWVDDGHCLSRGAIGAARVEQLVGGGATFVAGGGGTAVTDAAHAAVAVVNTSLRKTGWSFHAATAFRSADDGGVRIVDHLLGERLGNASGVFRIEDWASAVGRRASDVRIQSPVDNVPFAGNLTQPATPRILRSYGERLVRSIERA